MITFGAHLRSAARRGAFLWAAMALVSGGCRPEAAIRTYTVPKESPPLTLASAESTDRMLAAVLPDGERAWFFKVVGPQAAIDAQAETIESFFASVRRAAGKPLPDWQLPAGWQQQGPSGMRAATLQIPNDTKPLELTVTQLGWTGTPEELLSNVNRWRGQMQLPTIGADGLAECTRKLEARDATLTVVDLVGRLQATGMTPPFAGGAAPQLPAGHPPTDASAPLTFDVPEGWIELPAGGMRRAAFGVIDGDERALVTVLDFPVDAGPKMADPLENVNRWRAEVGLEPTAADALDAETRPIEIGGVAGRYLEAIPDAAKQADRATLAAMLRRGDVMWFFKLTGDRALVAAQRDHFKAFLESVEFTPQGGATNGN